MDTVSTFFNDEKAEQKLLKVQKYEDFIQVLENI